MIKIKFGPVGKEKSRFTKKIRKTITNEVKLLQQKVFGKIPKLTSQIYSYMSSRHVVIMHLLVIQQSSYASICLILPKIFTRKISDIRKHTTYTNFPANHQHLNSNKTTCSDKDNLFPWIWNLLVYSLKFLRDKVYTQFFLLKGP